MPAIIAAVAGLATGWFAAGLQHRLYREPEFGNNPLSGRRRLVWGLALGLAIGACWGISFRPGHYDPLPASMTAAAAAILCLASSTDFERRRIPNRLVYPSIVAAVVVAPLWPDRNLDEIAIGAAVAAGTAVVLLLVGALTGAVLGVNATAFGMGDAKLILLIGLLTGWARVVGALLLGVVFGGLPAFVLLFARGRGATYSYGPYLALGAIVILLWPGYY